MVDVDVEIPGVVAKGKLLTLTVSEAMRHHVVEFRADTLEAALEAVGLGHADVRRTSQTWAETLVRFLTNPIVASLLMTVGLLGILVEIRAPGFGLPGFLGLLSFGCVVLGALARPTRGLGRTAARRSGDAPDRSRAVRDSRLRRRWDRRGCRSRGGARHDPCGSGRDDLDGDWGTWARGDFTAARPRRWARAAARPAASPLTAAGSCSTTT